MHVPLLDLSFQYEPIRDQIIQEFSTIFDEKRFILGPKVDQLESDIAKYASTKHAIGVSSGSDALIAALMGLDIGQGDEVITTAFTFFATAGAIYRVGATPVFVDILPDTFNIDPSKIEAAITDKTKCIMPVHLFGQMADMDPILDIAKKHNLTVIEDSAQSIGSQYTSKDGNTYKAGSMGDIGCFSFFPSKNLGCCGDAGAMVTNNTELALKLKQLRNHGETKRYHHKYVGGNFRIDAIQAAILSIKLPLLDEQHELRRKNAALYATGFKDSIQKPFIANNCKTIYNQYTLKVKDREQLQEKLNEAGIGNAIYYPVPLHLQECFESLGYKKGDLPVTESCTETVLSLPIFGGLTDAQVQHVIDTLNKLI